MKNRNALFVLFSLAIPLFSCGTKASKSGEFEVPYQPHEEVTDAERDDGANNDFEEADVDSPVTLLPEDNLDEESDESIESTDTVEDLERLAQTANQYLEILKLGEKIFMWTNNLSLSGYTNHLESHYLQFTESLLIIDKRLAEAAAFQESLSEYDLVSADVKNRYLAEINPRIKMLRHLKEEIEAKGWKGFLDLQIWNANDMKDFLGYYPAECEILIDQFLEQAELTADYETFTKTEVMYLNLVQSCDEKSSSNSDRS